MPQRTLDPTPTHPPRIVVDDTTRWRRGFRISTTPHAGSSQRFRRRSRRPAHLPASHVAILMTRLPRSARRRQMVRYYMLAIRRARTARAIAPAAPPPPPRDIVCDGLVGCRVGAIGDREHLALLAGWPPRGVSYASWPRSARKTRSDPLGDRVRTHASGHHGCALKRRLEIRLTKSPAGCQTGPRRVSPTAAIIDGCTRDYGARDAKPATRCPVRS